MVSRKFPGGLNTYNGLWHNAIFDGYDFAGDAHPTLGYLISAVVGILVIGVVVFALTKLVTTLANRTNSTPPTSTKSAEPSGTSGKVRS